MPCRPAPPVTCPKCATTELVQASATKKRLWEDPGCREHLWAAAGQCCILCEHGSTSCGDTFDYSDGRMRQA
jgi:hypothetical protein